MNTFKITFVFICLGMSVLLVACGRGQTQIAPPDIRYGETECVQCRMIISDARFAAGYTFEVEGDLYESAPFDDIGGMLIYADEHTEHQIVAYWVHDFVAGEWIDAKDAYFLFSPLLETPMAFGTVAVDSREKAEQLLAVYDGQVLDWDGLLAKHHAGELVVSKESTISEVSRSFLAADGQEILLTIISPQAAHAQVGLQPMDILVTQKSSAAEWVPVDELTLEIIPEMPKMGHGSPKNQNPVFVHEGRYRGKVNFAMVGPWTVTVKVSQDEELIGEVAFKLDVR